MGGCGAAVYPSRGVPVNHTRILTNTALAYMIYGDDSGGCEPALRRGQARAQRGWGGRGREREREREGEGEGGMQASERRKRAATIRRGDDETAAATATGMMRKRTTTTPELSKHAGHRLCRASD